MHDNLEPRTAAAKERVPPRGFLADSADHTERNDL